MERATGQWGLADYHILKQLYKGKASNLYHATCRQSGAAVALKFYSKRRLSELNWYQVEREIRLRSQLRHPNIIQLHAAFEDDTHIFMVCEFAAGGDLYEDLKRSGGQLQERQVAEEVLPPFMAALAHMHARCIIHRDIKPGNILLAGDRGVRVADFGLSTNWGEERPVTRAGLLDYLSPEVLLCPEKSRPEENKERVDLGYGEAVDVWAVGVLAYELLVGRPPFERESREATYACISKQEPALPNWISEPAKDFITTALAKSARKRPSIAELLRHAWILQHARRPSVPTASRATSDMHLPLHELGPLPFAELHRPSMHGAQSSRDLGSLLLAPPSGASSPFNDTLRTSTLPATSPLPGQGGLRPTTANSSSRLARQSAATRPSTPTAAALAATVATIEASLPLSAFAAAAVQAAGAFESNSARSSEAHVGGSNMWQDGMEVDWPQPQRRQQSIAAAPLSTAVSIQPASPAVAPASTRDASFVSALSSTSTGMEFFSPIGGSSQSFTISAAAALDHHSLLDTQQQPAMGKPPCLRKALSQPLLHAELPPAPEPMAGSSRIAVEAMQAGPKLAASAAAVGVGSGLPPTSAEPGVEHAVLAPIPEQASSEAEAATPAEAPRQPGSGHLVLAPANPSSGIAQSATTLLNKILGRKPATAAASAAAEGPQMRRAAAAPAAPAAAVERSVNSPARASSAAKLPARTTCKQRLSPPLVNITVRADSSGYGQPASPRSPQQLPSRLHSSTYGGHNGDRWLVGDSIPAFYSPSTSLSSVISSLPRLASGTSTGTYSPHSVSSRKSSFSPTASRKGSQAAMGRAGPCGAATPRGSKTASMPGEATRARANGTVAAGGTMQAESVADAGADVQRSAASWSHPVMTSARSDGGSGKKPASYPYKLAATEIHLDPRGGGGGLYKVPTASCVAAKR